jgi:hypothetical protein
VSGANVNVTHPLGNTIIGAFSLGLNTTNQAMRAFTGVGTATYSLMSNAAFTIASFYSLTATNAGFNAAASDANALTITFQSTVSN